MKFRSLITRFFILALAFTTTIAFSQDDEEGAPLRDTTIESVRLRVQNDGDSAYFIFSDQVELHATNLFLKCDQLEVFAVRRAENEGDLGTLGAIEEIIATGNVRIEQAERVATAGKAVVQPNKQRIVLTESPVVVQAGTKLEADELIIERGAGTIVVNPTTPSRLRLTGPPIGDIGFEDPKPIEPEGAEQIPNAESDQAPAEATQSEENTNGNPNPEEDEE